MLKKFHGQEFVLDNENYFMYENSDKNANAGIYTRVINTAPDDVKFKMKKKFEKKLLVWLAISKRGISHLFIAPSGLAIDQEVYLNECIKKQLILFIKQHHLDGNFCFCPDLASSHYAKWVNSYLKEEKVIFVEKEDNPPCATELHLIENF